MKKFTFIIMLIILTPLGLGLAVFGIGVDSGSAAVSRAGQLIIYMGVPLTALAVVTTILVKMMIGGAFSSQKKKRSREDEYSEIEDINSSSYDDKQKKTLEYYGKHMSGNYKNATLKEKIIAFSVLGYFIGTIALVIIFGALAMLTPTFICMGLFGGPILIACIVISIKERISMKFNIDKVDVRDVMCGEVSGCYLSSSSSVGEGNNSRITGTVYRIVLTCGRGEYTAYSYDFYENGEVVCFVPRGRKLAAIIEKNYLMEKMASSKDDGNDIREI